MATEKKEKRYAGLNMEKPDFIAYVLAIISLILLVSRSISETIYYGGVVLMIIALLIFWLHHFITAKYE